MVWTLAIRTTVAAIPGTVLQNGYYWIRAVEQPNFHKCLQTKPALSTTTALLDNYTTAGQFNTVNGQLFQLISAPGEPQKLLYASVSQEKTRSGRTLAITFSSSPNTYGKFAFQGDSVTWTHPSIQRPNLSAWYVCEGKQLFINLGNYLYQTPGGCADETIYYYNDKRAAP